MGILTSASHRNQSSKKQGKYSVTKKRPVVSMAMKEIGLFLVCLFSLANGKAVRNVSNKCLAEKPCEVNAGVCTFDDECRGNLICTRNNCKGSTLSLYAKCCQEPDIPKLTRAKNCKDKWKAKKCKKQKKKKKKKKKKKNKKKKKK